jgi:hypothetical protein
MVGPGRGERPVRVFGLQRSHLCERPQHNPKPAVVCPAPPRKRKGVNSVGRRALSAVPLASRSTCPAVATD